MTVTIIFSLCFPSVWGGNSAHPSDPDSLLQPLHGSRGLCPAQRQRGNHVCTEGTNPWEEIWLVVSTAGSWFAEGEWGDLPAGLGARVPVPGEVRRNTQRWWKDKDQLQWVHDCVCMEVCLYRPCSRVMPCVMLGWLIWWCNHNFGTMELHTLYLEG